MQKRKIILASGSPRRKRLLNLLGVKFSVKVSNYEEDMTAHSDPRQLVKFLAMEKAREVARFYKDGIIIGADSVIVFKNKIIGKPKDNNDAKKILKNFSGQEHLAITGFAIIDTKYDKTIADFSQTVVKFRDLTDEEINDYVKTGEPLGMAGAYGLMDHGAFLAESVKGDFYTVIGLPLAKVYLALKELKVF